MQQCPKKKLAPEAKQHLVAYAWPGNIRELENLIRYLIATAPNEDITTDDLPEHIFETGLDRIPGHTNLMNSAPPPMGCNACKIFPP